MKPKIAVPALYIYGDVDGTDLAGGVAGQEKCFVAGYEEIKLRHVGHFPHREEPKVVVKAIEKMVGRAVRQ